MVLIYLSWPASNAIADLAAPVVVRGGDRQPIPAWPGTASWDGQHYFAVWGDSRTGAAMVYGARVDPSGLLLDPSGLLVADAGTAPTVASTPGLSLVVWLTSGWSPQVRYARVAPDGTVLDPGGLTLAGAQLAEQPFAVAASADGFIVVWVDPSYRVVAKRIDLTGLVLDANPIVVTTWGHQPTASSDGTTFFVVWNGVDPTTNTVATFASRLDAFGVPLDAPPLTLRTNLYGYYLRSSVSFASGDYLIVSEGQMGVTGERVSASGALLDPAPFYVNGGTGPAVAFDGTNWVVGAFQLLGTYSSQHQLGLTRVSTAGQVLDPTPQLLGVPFYLQQQQASVAGDGAGSFALWGLDAVVNMGITSPHLVGVRVDPSGNVLDAPPVMVSGATRSSTHPAVAASSNGFALGGLDDVGGSASPFVVGLGRADVPDGGMVFINALPFPPSLDGAGVAVWTRDSYWTGQASQVTVSAVTRSPGGKPWEGGVGAGSDGRVCVSPATGHGVVTWLNAGAVFLRRFGLTDGWLDAIQTQVTTPGAPSAVSVTCGAAGSRFVIAWTEQASPGNLDVRGVLLSDDGVLSGRADGGLPLGVSGLNEAAPAIDTDGLRALVVYEEDADDAGAIRGVWVDPELRLERFTLAVGAFHTPAIARADAGWAVVFARDAADGGSDVEGGLYTLTSDGGGALTPFAVAAGPEDERAPAVAVNPDGTVAIVYQRRDPATGAWLLESRLGTFPPGSLGGCPGSCPSGFCVDGVCCNSECGGGATDDCLACSIAAGGSEDGRCTPIARGAVCRAAGGACEEAAVCDGGGGACPQNPARPDGTPCDDGDAATHGDACRSGQCAGVPDSVCAPGAFCGVPPTKKTCGCSTGDGALALGAIALTLLRRVRTGRPRAVSSPAGRG